MPKDPIVKGIWQHYKGGFYEVLGIASDPTREGDFVVYEAIGSWATAVGLELELLEARNLPSVTNVLVNNPAEDTTIHDTQSETAIVLGANSNIVVAYNDTGSYSYPTPLNPSGAGYSLSTSGGASFTDQGSPPGNAPFWGAFDPVLASSRKTGTILLSDTSVNTNVSAAAEGERVNIFRSLDNGAAFSPPVNGNPGFVAGVDEADKPWIAVDNYPGPGYGNVYLAWTDFTFKNNGSTTDKGIYFTRSTDDGLTWGPSGGVPIAVKSGTNLVQGGFVTVGPDHAVYVMWWAGNTSQNILMSKSTDQGQTFSNPVIVTRLNTNGSPNGDLGLTYSNTTSSSFSTNAYPQAAVNPVTGDIYVVYNDQPKQNSKDKADIFFIMSTDGGNTWSSPLRVNDDNTTNDQWNPAIALTPDGSHLGIFWYDRRLDSADSLIDRFGTIATVSGHSMSFAPNFRITDVSFPPAFGQDPYIVSNYMGDYDMAAADNNYFYTTWGDNRLRDAFFANQPDVRFAKIPVEGEGPDSALAVPASATSAPAASTGIAAVPRPKSGLAYLAGGDGLLPGDFLAAAVGLAVPLPGQAAAVVSAAPAPTGPAAPPLEAQAIDRLFAATGRAFASATRVVQDGPVDAWGDALGQASWEQDRAAVFPPAAE